MKKTLLFLLLALCPLLSLAQTESMGVVNTGLNKYEVQAVGDTTLVRTTGEKFDGQYVDLSDYARGDGSNQTVQIRRAFRRAKNKQRKIWIPQGAWYASPWPKVPSNTIIRGEGWGTRLKFNPGGAIGLDFDGTKDSFLQNLTLEVGKPAAGFAAVELRNGAFRNSFQGVYLYADSLVTTSTGYRFRCAGDGAHWGTLLDCNVWMMGTGLDASEACNTLGTNGGTGAIKIIGGQFNDNETAIKLGSNVVGDNGAGGSQIVALNIGGSLTKRGLILGSGTNGITAQFFYEGTAGGASNVPLQVPAGCVGNFISYIQGGAGKPVIKDYRNSIWELGGPGIAPTGDYLAGGALHLGQHLELNAKQVQNQGPASNLYIMDRASASAVGGAVGGGVTFMQRYLQTDSTQIPVGGIFGVKVAGDGGQGGGLSLRGAPGYAQMAEQLFIGGDGARFTPGKYLLPPVSGAPATPPTGNLVIYNDGGVLKQKDGSGTVKTVTVAP